MSYAIYYVSFKLKKGSSVTEFLQAAENLNNEYISKQKGYISWKQLADGDTWADICTFETMDDLLSFESASRNPNDFATKFYSFINLNSCKHHKFSVVKSYGD